MTSARLSCRLAALVTAPALLLAACTADPDDANKEDPSANLANLMPIPETPATLDRAGLLAAIGEATSAYAAGTDDSEVQRALAGRRFAFRMPFGCPGDVAPKDSPLRLTVREDANSYEARATYSITARDVAIKPHEPADGEKIKPMVETVEGFWVEQPWLQAELCPVTQIPAAMADDDEKKAESKDEPEPMVFEHSVGIASFVTPDDSRVGSRSGRDFVKVVTLSEGESQPKGLFLLVEGRLRAWPDGRTIHCHPAPSGNRPICIAGVAIDRVAFERIDNRTIIAEWAN